LPKLVESAAVRQLSNVLQEAVEGSSGPWTYFIDNRPGAGVFGALAALSAAEASRSQGGTSIAAHAHHVAFAMEASAASIEGDRTPRDWKESWRVKAVNAAAWKELVGQLHREYRRLRLAVQSRAWSSEETFGETVGVIAHIAYHLGAIRQKAVSLRVRRAPAARAGRQRKQKRGTKSRA
jgi:DinB superfamily